MKTHFHQLSIRILLRIYAAEARICRTEARKARDNARRLQKRLMSDPTEPYSVERRNARDRAYDHGLQLRLRAKELGQKCRYLILARAFLKGKAFKSLEPNQRTLIPLQQARLAQVLSEITGTDLKTATSQIDLWITGGDSIALRRDRERIQKEEERLKTLNFYRGLTGQLEQDLKNYAATIANLEAQAPKE